MALYVFESVVYDLIAGQSDPYTITSQATAIVCDATNNTSVTPMSQMLPQAALPDSNVAQFYYSITFDVETLDSSVVQAVSRIISAKLNESISDLSMTRLIQSNAIKSDCPSLYSATAQRLISASYRLRAQRTVVPTQSPSSVSSADSVQSVSAIVGGTIGAVVLMLGIFGAVVLYYFRCREDSKLAVLPIPDIVDINYGAEYPEKVEIRTVNEMTSETRQMLQTIRSRRDNVASTLELFENAAVPNAVFINSDKGLYGDRFNSRLTVPVEGLSMHDTGILLHFLGMSKYVDQFFSNGINGAILSELKSIDDMDSCSLTVPKPVAKAFLKQLGQFRQEGVPKSIFLQ